MLAECERCEKLEKRVDELTCELDQCRQALEDRKIIERAKGLLMQYRNLSEDAAHKHLQRAATARNTSVAEIARTVVTALDVLRN